MNPPLRLLPVVPTGQCTGPAIVDYTDRRKSGLREVTFDIYPPPARPLREWRMGKAGTPVAGYLGLRECAKLLGIAAVDLSSLERGSATLSEADWARVEAAISAAQSRKDEP